MPLTEIQGDLFSTEAPVIAHGVNCRGAFGSGVAGQIAKRWPRVREAYMAKHNREGWLLGDVQLVTMMDAEPRRVVANLATQFNYGRTFTTEPHAKVEAIEATVRKLFAWCVPSGIYHVAMPRIGCGLGGLEWDAVRPVIDRLAAESDINVEVYFQ